MKIYLRLESKTKNLHSPKHDLNQSGHVIGRFTSFTTYSLIYTNDQKLDKKCQMA